MQGDKTTFLFRFSTSLFFPFVFALH